MNPTSSNDFFGDKEIRHLLHHNISKIHSSTQDTFVFDEFSIAQGDVRADVAVLNGVMAGYEIKSPRDSLTRLPHQQENYSKVFDFVTLVTCDEHLEKARNLLPDWWGLELATIDSGEIVLVSVREAQANSTIDPLCLVQLLWKEELIDIFCSHGIKAPRRLSRWDLWEMIVDVFSLGELQIIVRQRIKARGTNWRSGVRLLENGD